MDDTRPHSLLFINWYDHLDPKAGGAELVLWELAQHMQRCGTRVTMLVRRPKGAPRRENIAGCQIIRTTHNELLAMFISIFLYIFWLRHSKQIVVEFVNKLPYMAPVLTPKSHIVFQHHFNSHIWVAEFGLIGKIGQLIERWLFRAFYRRRDWVVVSQSTQDELSSLGLREKSVAIVSNGADHVKSPASVLKSEHPTALVISRLRRYKSVDVVIRAWQIVESRIPSAQLMIAGTGPHQHHCQSLITELKLQNVQMLGHISSVQKEELMATSWITLQPSLKEGWGLTVMEAARLATTSIASDVPGLRDSILNNKTGILVPHGDVPAWSNAILELLSNPELRESLGAEACIRSHQYTWEAAAKAFADALRASKTHKT